VQDRVLQAISAGDPDLAESIARAGLAQYVIWVRQHTAAAIHMGRKFYESIVDVDALALESLIDTMIRALEFAQKADLILPQLQRLRGSISVPRLATRIGAITARWLFRSGHQEEAVLELDCLGPPNQLSDTLAIWLVVRNYDLSEKQRESLLSRAIEVAACDEEKHLARLELASYYLANGKSRQALPLVKAIVDETASGKASDERLSAMVLKWAIIGDDTEFPPAFEAMKGQTEDTDRIRNGVLLIDRGKYGEAEDILGKLASNGDIKAILLLVDARLRSQRSGASREMFLSIRRERVPETLAYPYAHALALLVSAGGHGDLKEDAITLLSAIPPAGGEQDKQIRTMLDVLKKT
jgi:tetratricopeptide (TPR) repeat protein